jgi:hypothetical protein
MAGISADAGIFVSGVRRVACVGGRLRRFAPRPCDCLFEQHSGLAWCGRLTFGIDPADNQGAQARRDNADATCTVCSSPSLINL